MRSKLLLFVLLIPAFVALVKPGYFPMHDDIQGMRLLQLHKCILDLQIPCRWVPDMGFGFGYPQFNFYSPLPYYLMEIPVLLGVGILSSVKLGFAASLIGAAFAMYFLGNHLWGKNGGVISALFYTYAPYRAVDIYVRGAMGEAWAFVFMPLIILFTLKRSLLPLALSIAGLLLTHNITTIMFLPFYFVVLFFFTKLDLKKYRSIFVSGAWGALLAAFFVLPAFFEKDFTHVESMVQGYFNYLAHFVGIKQLLISTFWGYGVSTLGDLDGMSLSVGVLHWTIPVICLFLLYAVRKFRDLKIAALFFLLGFFALFLIHPKSQFIWDNISVMAYIQFPWRFLSIAVFCFSVSAGAISIIYKNTIFPLVLVVIAVFILYGSFFKPSHYIQISDLEKFSGDSWKQQQTISILDYLPIYALHPPTSAAPSTPQVINGSVASGDRGTNWQVWNVKMEENGSVQLNQFYFPGWEAKVDGRKVPIDSDNELGLVTVEVPKGTHTVEIRLGNTNVRLFSNLLSLIALVAIPVYIRKFR